MSNVGVRRPRLCPVMIFLCMVLASIFPDMHATAAVSSTSIEAVLVLDASNSMNASDKEKISQEAMKMFVDMSSIQGDKIGIVAYTDRIEREKALLKVSSETDKNDLKKFIDGLEKGMYTDISVGLNEAIKILDSGHTEGYVPLIILLADGNNDLDPSGSRKIEQANQELQQGIQKAKEKGYPVYTIGLNANGTLNQAVLENMSNATNGKFFLATSPVVLPEIVSRIFADHLNLKVQNITNFKADGDYQEVKVNIPNSSVAEANISIISGQPVEVKLIDPTGKERVIPSENIVFSKSQKYSMLKMVKPAKGEWIVKIKGVTQDSINVNLIFNYDMQLKMEPLQDSYKKDDIVTVRAFLESDGKKIASEELYQQMKATILITNKETQQTSEIAMKSSGSFFEGTYKMESSQSYELKVRAEDASFYRETEPTELKVSATAQQKPQPKKERKTFPWMTILLAVGGGIVGIAVLIFVRKKIKDNNKRMIGQFEIEIRDNESFKNESPQYRPLDRFRKTATFYQIFGLRQEFSETENIVFIRENDRLVLVNKSSDCNVEKNGILIETNKKESIYIGDKFAITVSKVNKTIFVSYIS